MLTLRCWSGKAQDELAFSLHRVSAHAFAATFGFDVRGVHPVAHSPSDYGVPGLMIRDEVTHRCLSAFADKARREMRA
jgi:hypothetical protein